MKVTLYPWRRASEPVPIELFGEPLLIEDFLGNYVVGHYSCFRWWVKAYDGEDKIFREENVKSGFLSAHFTAQMLNQRIESKN